MNKIKIFLASSGELKTEREEIERFINKENNNLVDNHVFLQLVIWEDLCHSFHGERIQDHFNEEMLQCEIVIALIFTKVGEFTKEEFDKAYESFKAKQNPKHLYVYFKKASIDSFEITESFMHVLALKKEIEKAQQFYGQFETVQDLLLKLKKQFDQIIPELISMPQNSIQNELKNASVSSPSYCKLDEINNYVKHTCKKEKYYDEKNYITTIQEHLKSDKTLSIISCTGMGGVGKSTLAVEYANDALEKGLYNYTIWLGIESGIESAVKQFCIRYLMINDDGKQEIFFYLNSFFNFVNQSHKVLLILDNYSSASISKDALLEFIGRVQNQDIILTSREKTNLENQKTIEVDIFENVDDALVMFEKNSIRQYTEAEKEVLKKIVKRLGLLPLAIEITAIYLSNYPDILVESYLKELERECVNTLESIDPDDMPRLHKENIRATLKIAEKVQNNPRMVLYLKLFSLLAAEPISEDILEYIVKELEPDFNAIRFKQTLGDLKRFYYIRQEENDYSMHRLLQEVVSEEYLYDKNELREFLSSISLGILWWMRQAFEDNQYGDYFDISIVHIDYLLKRCENLFEIYKAEICLLICKSAYILTKTSKLSDAYEYSQQAFRLLEYHPIDKKIEEIMWGQLAAIHHAQGDYTRAYEEANKSLQIALNEYGENHLYTTSNYVILGRLYHDQGYNKQALEIYNKALNIRIALKGEHYIGIAGLYNNIGLIYNDEGNYKFALDKYNKAYSLLLELHQENHPITAVVYNNIGLLYYKERDYSNAIKMYEQSIKIKETILGDNHPDLAVTYSNLGQVYTKLHDYERSIKDYKKSIEILTINSGENHPDLAATYNNLGQTYRVLCEYDLALQEYNKSINLKKISLKENHPDIAATLNNIAYIYEARHEYYKAFKAMLDAIKIYLNNDKYDLLVLYIKSSYKALNEFAHKAQRTANKDQKEFMRKKIKEIQEKVKELKIKLS